MNFLKSHKEFLLFSVLPIILFFVPVLFMGKIFLSTDALQYSYPLAYFFKTHYGAAINPYNFLGFPLASSFHYGFFNPVYYLVFKFFSVFTGYHLIILFDFLLAAFFTYLFARELGQSKPAASVATSVFSLSQMAVYFASSLIVTNTLWILPAMLYFVHKITEDNERRINLREGLSFVILVMGLAFTMGLAWLSAHQQWIVMSLVTAGVYALYRIYQKPDFQWKPGFLILVTVLGGFVMGYSQIHSTFLFFSETTRANFIFYDYVKWLDLLKVILPNFSAPVFLTGEFLPFIGLVGLSLAFVGIWHSVRQRANYFWLGVLIVATLFLFWFSPLAVFLQHLPIFKYFAQPARWWYVSGFSLALFAGWGTDAFEKFKGTSMGQSVLVRFTKIGLAVFALFAFGNVVYALFSNRLLIFAQNLFDTRFYAGTSGLPLDYYHSLIGVFMEQVFSNFSFANPWTWLFFFSLVCVRLLFKYTRKEFIALATSCNLLFAAMLATPLTSRALLTSPTAVGEFLKEREPNPASYRILPVRIPEAQYREIQALHPEEREEGARFAIEALLGNTNIFAGIQSAGGYDPTVNARLQKIIISLEGGNIDVRAFHLLGIKYVISSYEINVSGLVQVFETNATKFHVPLRVYEYKP